MEETKTRYVILVVSHYRGSNARHSALHCVLWMFTSIEVFRGFVSELNQCTGRLRN